MKYLKCNGNALTALDVSANTALLYLWCYNNSIATLDLSTNSALENLHCYNNELTDLNVRNGNNANTSNLNFRIQGNPNLTCVQVDNAIYAIDKKHMDNKNGLIVISTASNKENVILTVKDNGGGISEEIKDKLFDPFFTTKQVGDGTGLGLSIVRNIINIHSGKIILNSKLNVGTEITIELPIK